MNGGIFNVSLMQCDCPDDFTGTYCERRYYDCSEAYHGGMRGSGSSYREVYIQPLNVDREVLVECLLVWGGWTTVEERGLNCDIDKTWNEYKAGWDSCSRWLGLEVLHHITHQAGVTCNLDIFITLTSSVSGQFYYGGITFDSEANNYTLDYDSQWQHVDDPVGDGFAFGGSPKSIKGKGFATSDRPDPQGCAVSAEAGWWYGEECPETNLHKRMSSDSAITNVAKWPDVSGTLEKVMYQRLQLKVLR